MTLKSPIDKTGCFAIIFDTNMLFVDKQDQSAYSFLPTPKFQHFLNFKKTNGISLAEIFIPEICIDEITKQKQENYQDKKEKIKELSEYFNLKLDIDNQELKQIRDAIELFCKENHIKILPYPNDTPLKKFITRAINRHKPFFITNAHKDYGFKDVVLWESILSLNFSSKRINKIIFCTKDEGFQGVQIYNEFQSKYKNVNLQIISDWEELQQEYLSLHIELIADADIDESRLLATFQDNNINIIKIIDSKQIIEKIDDFVIKGIAKVEMKNSDITEEEYYYDVKNREYSLTWEKTENVEEN